MNLIKKIIVFFMFMVLSIVPCFAGNIQYGYNPDGSYVPQSIGGVFMWTFFLNPAIINDKQILK